MHFIVIYLHLVDYIKIFLYIYPDCGKEVTDNAAGYLEVLTYKRKELNKCLSSFFQKKSRRISA